ncbi:PAS-domain containing protein [Roseicyclus marinus]|uniref:Diguanylate cyclase n=1 Tax=Roseicyclus marinus TaxID=2161673 RepID=A0AA48H592_9RHOB|nr:diguanylate cyclase [Roseicyclus marinus]
MQADLFDLVLFGGISLLSALAALWLPGLISRRVRPGGNDGRPPVLIDAMRRYEFHEGYLVSPIDPNDAFLSPDTDRGAAFGDLTRALAMLHADLPGRLGALARRGEAFVLTGRFGVDALSVAGCSAKGRMVVMVGPAEVGTGREIVDVPVLRAIQAESEDLRHALDLGGAAIWTVDAEGRVIWANAAYLALVDRVAGRAGAEAVWPLPALFGAQVHPRPEPDNPRRCSLSVAQTEPGPEGGTLWFEVTAIERGDGLMFCAAPIDRLVAAETALRNFVQTLSKTFAHLPIGLAIFDKRRELVLFNPALVTLSTLPPQALAGRPRLVDFLDALRDRKRMPEPKDYKGWRDSIAHLEARAEQGTYEDVWALPGGQSLRVMGRPHPDGAVAFMFEDITAEVTLTQQFRGELELHRAVIDAQPGAMAVFAGDGRRVLANRAYRQLWRLPEEAEARPVFLPEAMARWQAACLPSSAASGCWGDIRRIAERKAAEPEVRARLVLRDRRCLDLSVAAIAGGAIMVRFEPEGAPACDRAQPVRSVDAEMAPAPGRGAQQAQEAVTRGPAPRAPAPQR